MRPLDAGVRKLSRRQHRVAGISVQEILLAHDFKIAQAPCDRVIGARNNIHGVGYAVVARVSHPLTAGHVLPICVRPEAIAHSAVASRHPDAMIGNRLHHCLTLVMRNLAHCPDRNDQAELREISIKEGIEGIPYRHGEALRFQNLAEEISHLLWFVSIPSAPNDQCRTICHIDFRLPRLRPESVRIDPLFPRGRWSKLAGVGFVGALCVKNQRILRRTGMMQGIFKLIRPKQWAKNLLVFAAFLFTGSLSRTDHLTLALIAFAAMCLVSSATYVFNDLADVERDRAHPVKQNRPIAAGLVSTTTAWLVGVTMGICGLGLGFSLGEGALTILGVYAVTQVLYNWKIKSYAVADVFTIAFGFVLRAALGAAAIGVGMSGWLFLCTASLALMLGFAKRRNEYILQGKDRSLSRQSLSAYSQLSLDMFVAIFSGLAIMCYGLYTLESETARTYPGLILTFPFVVYGVCRYLLAVYTKDEGGEPADTLFGDRHVLFSVIGFLLAAALAMSKVSVPLISLD